MVALWRKIDGDGSTPATGAGQVDSLMWGSYPGLLPAGRSGHARGNRRGVARRFLCTRTEVKREGEGERGRHGRATQRRRVGEGGGSGACGAQAGGRGSIGRQDAGAVAAVTVGRHDRACDHWGGGPVGQKWHVGRLFGPVPMNNDIFYLFKKIQMAQMELIKRGPSRSQTNSNKI
jgi:hypothetical protein